MQLQKWVSLIHTQRLPGELSTFRFLSRDSDGLGFNGFCFAHQRQCFAFLGSSHISSVRFFQRGPISHEPLTRPTWRRAKRISTNPCHLKLLKLCSILLLLWCFIRVRCRPSQARLRRRTQPVCLLQRTPNPVTAQRRRHMVRCFTADFFHVVLINLKVYRKFDPCLLRVSLIPVYRVTRFYRT